MYLRTLLDWCTSRGDYENAETWKLLSSCPCLFEVMSLPLELGEEGALPLGRTF